MHMLDGTIEAEPCCGEGSVPNAVGKYRSADSTAPLRTNEKKDQTFKKK